MLWLIASLFIGFAVLWALYLRPKSRSSGPIHVKSIVIYPIKSMRGIEVQSAKYDRLGFENDRRFLLVYGPDPEEEKEANKPLRWITQREYPRIALVQPSLPSASDAEADSTALLVDAPGMPQLRVRKTPSSATRLVVKVNDQQVPALHCGEEAAQWFSKYIGRPAVLATFLGVEEHKRAIDPVWEARNPERQGRTSASFVDDDPFLFVPEESLDGLNARLAPQDKVTMRHFRPSVVVTGSGVPFDEDHWERFAILPGKEEEQGQEDARQEFDVSKPCARCVIPTIDPDKGVFRESKEPTVTLRKFRRVGDDVFFGQYAVHRQTSGRISVGDRLVVVKRSSTGNTAASRVRARKAEEGALKQAREDAAK